MSTPTPEQTLRRFAEEFKRRTTQMPPEFAKVVEEHFWDMFEPIKPESEDSWPRWRDAVSNPPTNTLWALVTGDTAIATRAWNAMNKQWEDWEGCTAAGLNMRDITHWMPLPEPPDTPESVAPSEDVSAQDFGRRMALTMAAESGHARSVPIKDEVTGLIARCRKAIRPVPDNDYLEPERDIFELCEALEREHRARLAAQARFEHVADTSVERGQRIAELEAKLAAATETNQAGRVTRL